MTEREVYTSSRDAEGFGSDSAKKRRGVYMVQDNLAARGEVVWDLGNKFQCVCTSPDKQPVVAAGVATWWRGAMSWGFEECIRAHVRVYGRVCEVGVTYTCTSLVGGRKRRTRRTTSVGNMSTVEE